MLLDTFYNIESIECAETSIDSRIILNIKHPVYKGHFPHQAVVPGVCMMQIVAELTSVALKKELALMGANQAKFLIPILPEKHPKLNVKVKYSVELNGNIKITGSIYAEELTFFKLKGVLG
ncbi:MAG: hypothetical protein MK207_07985 [Saprospiraceae bacterium]|nr:hypothetical protein [Saprospiraceae bacterium]